MLFTHVVTWPGSVRIRGWFIPCSKIIISRFLSLNLPKNQLLFGTSLQSQIITNQTLVVAKCVHTFSNTYYLLLTILIVKQCQDLFHEGFCSSYEFSTYLMRINAHFTTLGFKFLCLLPECLYIARVWMGSLLFYLFWSVCEVSKSELSH